MKVKATRSDGLKTIRQHMCTEKRSEFQTSRNQMKADIIVRLARKKELPATILTLNSLVSLANVIIMTQYNCFFFEFIIENIIFHNYYLKKNDVAKDF